LVCTPLGDKQLEQVSEFGSWLVRGAPQLGDTVSRNQHLWSWLVQCNLNLYNINQQNLGLAGLGKLTRQQFRTKPELGFKFENSERHWFLKQVLTRVWLFQKNQIKYTVMNIVIRSVSVPANLKEKEYLNSFQKFKPSGSENFT
jgi:hypothetical protein